MLLLMFRSPSVTEVFCRIYSVPSSEAASMKKWPDEAAPVAIPPLSPLVLSALSSLLHAVNNGSDNESSTTAPSYNFFDNNAFIFIFYFNSLSIVSVFICSTNSGT